MRLGTAFVYLIKLIAGNVIRTYTPTVLSLSRSATLRLLRRRTTVGLPLRDSCDCSTTAVNISVKMLCNSQRRVREGEKHQSMLGDQPDVVFRAVKLHRFHAGQTISKAKLHLVLLNHLTEEESTKSESLHNHSSRIFWTLPWGDLAITGSTVTNEWN